jgi:hypothetical protein
VAEYGASPYRVLNYFGASQDRPVQQGFGIAAERHHKVPHGGTKTAQLGATGRNWNENKSSMCSM